MWCMKAFQGNVWFFWKTWDLRACTSENTSARNVCRGWGRQSHRREKKTGWRNGEETSEKAIKEAIFLSTCFVGGIQRKSNFLSHFISNLCRAIASVMLPAFFYLVGWPMNSTLMWSHLEDGHLVGGSFANGAKIEFLISEKSDFDLKVGIFF